MSTPIAPAPLPGDVNPEALLRTLLDVSLTGILLLRPLYGGADAASSPVDFAYVHLNAAAQQMLQLPECPKESFLTLFPTAQAAGIFEFYRDAFLSGQVARRQSLYQADSLDGYYLLVAQRQGPLLVVSFSDTNEQSRSAVEEALRETQAAEQAARAEAEAERQRFYEVLMQLPAQVAINRGPDHVFELVNGPYQQLFPTRPVQGLPARQALPELQGQQFFELLDQVHQTGEPFYGQAMPALVDYTNSGRLEQRYFDVLFKPLHNARGQVESILNFSYDVTELVLSRQQTQTFNEELAVVNEELRASGDEYLTANVELGKTQAQLRQLNQELETRVQERTQQTLALQAELLAAAQRQAAERETVYQVFTQVPPAVAILRGPEHRFAYVNPAYQGFFGDLLLLGRTVVEATAGMLDPQYLALLDEVYQTGRAAHGYEAPVQVLTPGGSPRQAYFNFTYSPYQENGQQMGICIFAYEITEQVLARQEREVQQQLVSTVFEQVPAGIWVVQGPTYVFEFINSTMTHILGHSMEQALGRPYFDVLPELSTQGLPELFRQVWEQGEPVFVEELPAQLAYHAPGENSYFTFVFQPLHDNQGRVTRIACVAQDVTTQVLARQQVQLLNEELAVINEELRVSNEDLHSSNHQLTRTNVDLDTFVYTASHDLKAPIANLEGLLTALQDELPTAVQQEEVIRELLRLMRDSVERFRTTIDQLTDVSRLQHAQDQPAEYVRLAPVVEAVRLDLTPLLQSTHAQLTVEIEADLTVLFSPKNLRSVVYNLLSNALKYRRPDQPPRVLLSASATSSQAVLTVTDNGLGLTDSQQQRLFGLFQRMHTHVEGTGVGLYMIKRMVENAGGRIAVRSRVGTGSVFQVTLPASNRQP